MVTLDQMTWNVQKKRLEFQHISETAFQASTETIKAWEGSACHEGEKKGK